MTKTEKLLRELIAIPSVNPAFLPDGARYTGEKDMVACLQTLANRAGLETETQTVFPERSNLMIRLSPRGRKIRHRILLAPHLDTVGGEVLPARHFTPRQRAGRLYGRGACDTKGSVAAMLSAMLEILTHGLRPASTEIVFAGLVDEENNQCGSRALVRSRFKADLAIVGEPTRGQVITAHKGDLWLQLETRGRAAHGSRPDLGRNAVHAMAKVVDVLETDYRAFLCQKRHLLLGQPTINVGTIQGGRQPNIVPDHCVIRIDRRTIPGEKDTAVKRELLEFLKARGAKAGMIDTKGVPSLPLETNPKNVWVRLLMRSVGQTKPRGVDFFSDAGVLAAGRIPSVLFGPGDIAQAHTEDEWIELDQLETAQAKLVKFFRQLP